MGLKQKEKLQFQYSIQNIITFLQKRQLEGGYTFSQEQYFTI